MNEAGRWRGWGTNRRVGGQTDIETRGKTTRSDDKTPHTLSGEDACVWGWGVPAKAAPPHPHPACPVHTPRSRRTGRPWGRAGNRRNYSTRGSHPGAERSGADRVVTGTLPLAALGLFPLPGGGAWLRGRRRPQAPAPVGVLFPPHAQPRHMTAQRLRRSAPWKRRAACTCLQRAQPTLLSSSLKSRRMCQLYLAEHST